MNKVFVSHCHFCPTVMTRSPVTKGVLVPDLFRWAAGHNIDVVRMRCPETEFAGPDRKSHGRAWYNKQDGFRPLCKEIAMFEAARMKRFGQVIAVIGVSTSPACGTGWENNSSFFPSGIYMEELRRACERLKLYPTFVSIWPKHHIKMRATLDDLIKGKEEPGS